MPSTQLNIRLGSNNSIFQHDIPPKVRRSTFNLSRKRDFCLEAGAIVPVDLIETVPGDSFEISVNYLLKSQPLVVAPFTSYRIRTHWYYCRQVDLWKGGLTYITKGRTGAVELTAPKVNFNFNTVKSEVNESGTDVYYSCPEGLSSYLGLPTTQYFDLSKLDMSSIGYRPFDSGYSIEFRNNISSRHSFNVNALPFLMYQKIYRMAYTVPNLLQDNMQWFPEDISDGWRINYDKSNLGDSNDDTYNGIFSPTDSINGSSIYTTHFSPSVSDTAINLLQLRYGLFEDDRFTTALPWAQRGSAPRINLNASVTIPSITSFGNIQAHLGSTETLDSFTDNKVSFTVDSLNNTDTSYGRLILHGYDPSTQGSLPQPSTGSSYARSNSLQSVTTIPETTVSVSNASFNLNQFRELVALSVWQERNSRTQGGYNETIYAHFGVNPRADDFEPRYIGGTSDIISFGEVVQTSQTADTPQGTQTGLASTNSRGNVGFFRCPDYGYIMGVMIIQPETVYSTSIEKLWYREQMEDYFMPEDEGLGLQEILKKELFVSGSSTDENLFGYQERNTEYKTRDNQAIGWFGLPSSVDKLYSAYSQCRDFTSQPSLSHQFLVMSPENMRRDFLSVPSMPAFRCSFATQIRAHRPMAYKTVPQTFGF